MIDSFIPLARVILICMGILIIIPFTSSPYHCICLGGCLSPHSPIPCHSHQIHTLLLFIPTIFHSILYIFVIQYLHSHTHSLSLPCFCPFTQLYTLYFHSYSLSLALGSGLFIESINRSLSHCHSVCICPPPSFHSYIHSSTPF